MVAKISEPIPVDHQRSANLNVPHQCKLLNEPPIVLLGAGSFNCGGGVAGTARRRSRSPGSRRSAHSIQQQPIRVQQQHPAAAVAGNGIYAQFGDRRPSLREHRHFGTNGRN
uniref:Uncharacterized protein n=1 Tax=Globodera rostochiensis TaxID=31243 RepID=A0A914I0N2_GLORO